jgi:hypothetical protein
MGVWGPGLYSGDFAADLRQAIRAVVRLPFEAEKLVDILVSMEPSAARELPSWRRETALASGARNPRKDASKLCSGTLCAP